MNMDSKRIEFLRKQFPEGTRIKLNFMNDPYAPVPPGTTGTLAHIDSMGTFHMKWDNGRSLGIIPGEDDFEVIRPEPQILKLYMPLTGQLKRENYWPDYDSDDDYDYEGEKLYGHSLMEYAADIQMALEENRLPEEKDRGVMHWYDEGDEVDRKVKSAIFKAEAREGKLWGVAECCVIETLNQEELDKLKDYISGQASDGWGESFDQYEIEVSDGSLYVSLWSMDYFWSIQTEAELFEEKTKEKQPLTKIIQSAETRKEEASQPSQIPSPRER